MKSYYYICYFALFFFLITEATITAQDDGRAQARKDSLRHVITTLEGEKRLDAYEQLSLIYFGENKDQQTMDSLLAIYGEMDAEAEKFKNIKLRCRIKANILSSYRNIGMYDEIIELAPEYLHFLEKNEMWVYLYSSAYQSYSLAYLEKGEPEKAIQIAHEMYEHAKARSNNDGMAAAYFQIGVLYESTDRMEEAESYIQQAIDLIKDKEIASQVLPNYYFRLGNILISQRRFTESLQVAHDCEKAVERQQEQVSATIPASYWGTVWKLYSLVYSEMGDYDKSETYLDKIDELYLGLPILKKNNYLDRALILEQRKEYEKALNFANKACEISPVYRDYFPGGTLWIKASILFRMGQTDEAMKCIEEAVLKSDSIRNMDFNRQLDELRVIHEVDTLTAKNEQTQKQLLYSIIGCTILLLALSIWIYYSRRLQKKNFKLAKQILEQSKLYDEVKIRQSEIEQLRLIAQENKSISDESKTEKNHLFEKLEQYMNEQQPYTNPELNRKMIADALNTNEKYLREIIKSNADITVSDYINLHRLKHANKLLLKPAKYYTIDTIATESGFSSRTLFYKYYRSNYGLTPNEFRKNIQSTKIAQKNTAENQ